MNGKRIVGITGIDGSNATTLSNFRATRLDP